MGLHESDEDIALYRDAYSPSSTGARRASRFRRRRARERSSRCRPSFARPTSTDSRSSPSRRAAISRTAARRLCTPAAWCSISSALNRVLEVNERNAYALVEPGVSYFDLYEHIQESEARCLDRPARSGLGQRRWQRARRRRRLDGLAFPRSLRRPLRHGSRARQRRRRAHGHGRAAELEVLAAQSLRASGRGSTGCFRQSNFGVVTKMGFYLMPQPEALLSATVTSNREE